MGWKDWSLLDRAIAVAVLLVAATGVLHLLFGLRSIVELLGHPDAAGWVQAIGSIVALFVAIWVPKNLYEREAKERREKELERAYLAVIDAKHLTQPPLMHIHTLNQECNTFFLRAALGERHDMKIEELLRLLAELPVPTASQLQDLSAAGHHIARDVVSGLRYVDQIKANLMATRGALRGHAEFMNFGLLQGYAQEAIRYLERAQAAMTKFLEAQDKSAVQ